MTKLLFHAVSHNSDATISKQVARDGATCVLGCFLPFGRCCVGACCSTQSSKSKCRRSDLAVSFPLPSGEHRTTTFSDSPNMLQQIEPRAACVLERSSFFFCDAVLTVWSRSGTIALQKLVLVPSEFPLDGREVFRRNPPPCSPMTPGPWSLCSRASRALRFFQGCP